MAETPNYFYVFSPGVDGTWSVNFFRRDAREGLTTKHFTELTRDFDTREEAEAYGAETVAAYDSARRLEASAEGQGFSVLHSSDFKEMFQAEFMRRAVEDSALPTLIYRTPK